MTKYKQHRQKISHRWTEKCLADNPRASVISTKNPKNGSKAYKQGHQKKREMSIEGWKCPIYFEEKAKKGPNYNIVRN